MINTLDFIAKYSGILTYASDTHHHDVNNQFNTSLAYDLNIITKNTQFLANLVTKPNTQNNLSYFCFKRNDGCYINISPEDIKDIEFIDTETNKECITLTELKTLIQNVMNIHNNKCGIVTKCDMVTCRACNLNACDVNVFRTKIFTAFNKPPITLQDLKPITFARYINALKQSICSITAVTIYN